VATGGIGSVGPSLYQYLQAGTDQASDRDAGVLDQALASQSQAQIQIEIEPQAVPHGHRGGGQHGGLSKLIDTVEQALQSASSTDDPNKVVEDALAKLLSGDSSGNGANATDPDNDATGSGTASNSAAKQSFVDFLKSHGVDLQQFRADFLAAVQHAQNGQVNTANALKSLPSGSSVDLSG
jgi:hypothetical protein